MKDYRVKRLVSGIWLLQRRTYIFFWVTIEAGWKGTMKKRVAALNGEILLAAEGVVETKGLPLNRPSNKIYTVSDAGLLPEKEKALDKLIH